MTTATATAPTGADVVADGRRADDGDGAAAGVIDPTHRVTARATDLVPTGAAATAANGNRAIGGRRTVTAVAVIGNAHPASPAHAGTAAAAHVGRVITAAVTASATAARLAAQCAGAWPGRTAMPTALATQTATTATATAVKRPRHPAATAATGSGVGGHGHVFQGQDPGVENPPGHRARGTVATIATVARYQTTSDHQTIERHGTARRHFDDPSPVLAIENHIRRTVIVQVAINGDVFVDQQFGGQLHRHAAVEGDGIAVLRRSDRGTQRADARVAIVSGRPGGQAPLIVGHGHCRQHVGAFDSAGGDLQIPVAAHAGAVAGRRHITTGQLRQGVDETQTPFAFGGVAAVDHDVATDVHVLADFRQHRTAGRDVVGRQVTVAQPQIARIAVGDDLHRADALMGVQIVGNLLQAVPGGVELNHLGAGGDAFEQAVGILDPGIDEHHALSRHGNGRHRGGGVGLAVGVLTGDRFLGDRWFRRVSRCVAVSLGGIGHGGCDRAVEQHARLQGHDHWRGQRSCALGYPRLAVAPPHVAHPDSNVFAA